MALSMGAVRNGSAWKTCIVEKGKVVESCAFEDISSTLSYLERTCARYPELALAIAPACEGPYQALNATTSQRPEAMLSFPLNDWSVDEARDFLIAIKSFSPYSHLVPSPRFLPAIPPYRKLLPASMGTANDVCTVATLLYRLRERDATWPEMQFLFLQLNLPAKSIQVLENGRIVNSVSAVLESDLVVEQMSADFQQALWEDLTRDLAGLMAVHHCEDIVVLGSSQEAFVERFAESYQVYLFPSPGTDAPGFEAALGAAILAEGLYLPGRSSEIVEQLQIREAGA